MKRRAIFFDRDNTLIACDGYLGDPSKVVLVDGAADAVARARQLGYATVVVSNQSGVARGMFDEAAVHAVNARLDELLEEQNPAAVVDRHEFCPFHPDAAVERYRLESDLRKPKPGMILCAAEKLALDLSRSWLIGDAPRDVEAGRAAGCRTILFQDASLAASPAALAAAKVRPDFVVTSLREALDHIEQNPAAGDDEDEPGDDESDPAPAAARESGPPAAGTAPMSPAPPSAAPRPTARAEKREPAIAPVATPPAPAASSSQPRSPAPPPALNVNLARLESLAEQILQELKRREEQPANDFSVSKLLAGIVQVTTLAILFLAYLNRGDPAALLNTLLFALVLQTLTVALLIMSRQR